MEIMTTAPAFEATTYHAPSWEAIADAHARIAPRIHHPPILTSASLDSMAGASFFFKCENLQKPGSFKIRGAANAILSLSNEQAARGIVTQSSGNHGAAVACAAAWRGVPAYIVFGHDDVGWDAPPGRSAGPGCPVIAARFGAGSACILSLSNEQAARGIVTQSSGNHGAAVACAAAWRGVPAYIVMPKNAPKVKIQAIEAYGGKVTFCEAKVSSRKETCDRVQAETGGHPVHPFDEIGRGAGRGRGENSGGAGSFKKKKKKDKE